MQTAVCGVDIFWYIFGKALKHKEKINVEKSVGNVDNSLKTRLRFPGAEVFDGLRRRKLWKVNAKKRRKYGGDFWQNSVLTYKENWMKRDTACSLVLHITDCNNVFPGK